MRGHSTESQPDLFDKPATASKVCAACKIKKPLSDFYMGSLDKRCGRRFLKAECIPCTNERDRQYNRTAKGQRRLAKRRLKAYSLTVDDYSDLLQSQGGVCAICGCEDSAIDRRYRTRRQLAVDHDHVTGKPRGLLCTACNRAIGLMKDDPLLLRAAATYLESHRG